MNFSVADHLGDALAGQVLEIAGLEDLDHALLDVLRQRLVLLVLQARGERRGHLVDLFGARQDRVGRALGAADDRVELVGDARHLRPFEAGDVHGRDLLLGLVDRVVDEVELALELRGLGDLRLVGVDHLLR